MSDATNILVRTPSAAAHTERACARLFAGDTGTPDHGLWITYMRSPDEKLAEWHSHSSAAIPATMGSITVGDQSRSATVADGDISTRPGSPVIRAVSEPTDLTGLSIEVSRFFEAWDAANGEISLCFDSLTPLLMYVSVERAYRFLHTLTSEVNARGATAHYHLNPDAHTAQTMNRLTSLFNVIAECTEDGKLKRATF